MQSVKYVMGHDLLDKLEDLDMPVLLVYGREDPIIQAAGDDVLENLNYNAYPFIFDTAQHYPMLRKPANSTVFCGISWCTKTNGMRSK